MHSRELSLGERVQSRQQNLLPYSFSPSSQTITDNTTNMRSADTSFVDDSTASAALTQRSAHQAVMRSSNTRDEEADNGGPSSRRDSRGFADTMVNGRLHFGAIRDGTTAKASTSHKSRHDSNLSSHDREAGLEQNQSQAPRLLVKPATKDHYEPIAPLPVVKKGWRNGFVILLYWESDVASATALEHTHIIKTLEVVFAKVYHFKPCTWKIKRGNGFQDLTQYLSIVLSMAHVKDLYILCYVGYAKWSRSMTHDSITWLSDKHLRGNCEALEWGAIREHLEVGKLNSPDLIHIMEFIYFQRFNSPQFKEADLSRAMLSGGTQSPMEFANTLLNKLTITLQPSQRLKRRANQVAKFRSQDRIKLLSLSENGADVATGPMYLSVEEYLADSHAIFLRSIPQAKQIEAPRSTQKYEQQSEGSKRVIDLTRDSPILGPTTPRKRARRTESLPTPSTEKARPFIIASNAYDAPLTSVDQGTSSPEMFKSPEDLASSEKLASPKPFVSPAKAAPPESFASPEDLASAQELVSTEGLASPEELTSSEHVASSTKPVQPEELVSPEELASSEKLAYPEQPTSPASKWRLVPGGPLEGMQHEASWKCTHRHCNIDGKDYMQWRDHEKEHLRQTTWSCIINGQYSSMTCTACKQRISPSSQSLTDLNVIDHMLCIKLCHLPDGHCMTSLGLSEFKTHLWEQHSFLDEASIQSIIEAWSFDIEADMIETRWSCCWCTYETEDWDLRAAHVLEHYQGEKAHLVPQNWWPEKFWLPRALRDWKIDEEERERERVG